MRRHRSFIGPQGMGGMVGLWGASSLIRSVQRGDTTLTATSQTATITAVVPENSELVLLGINSAIAGQVGNSYFTDVVLTNATTLTFTRNSAANNVSVSWEVVEYAPGVIKSKQTGRAAIGTADTTITAVDMNKTRVSHLGLNDSVAVTSNDVATKIKLTTATNLNITSGNPNTQTTSWQVLEFF